MTEVPNDVPEEFQRELQRKAALMVKLRESPYVPIEPTVLQWAFILDERKEVFYGGAAGGGKSVAQLASALLHVDKPGYHALLIRRTYADLQKPGALMSMADEWLYGSDAKRKDKGKLWIFPSGATLLFGYMENDTDMLQYQGAAFSYVGYDEAAQFTPKQLQYLFSRLRQDMKTKTLGIPLRYRLTSNPGSTSHEYLRDRYVRPKEPNPGRLYIPAKMDDNPYLDVADYREMLKEMDVITRAQLERGDWFVAAEGGFFQNNLPIVPQHLSNGEWDHRRIQRCRAWDLAANNGQGDWAVGVLTAYDPLVKLWRVEHVARCKGDPALVEKLLRETCERDGGLIPQVVEEERGSSGKLAMRALRTGAFLGSPVYPVSASGDKTSRARLPATLVAAGDVELAPGPWNEAFLLELIGFPEMAHDDQVDGLSYSVHWISKQLGGTRVVSAARASISNSTASPTQTPTQVSPRKGGGMRVIRTNQGPGPLDKRYG